MNGDFAKLASHDEHKKILAGFIQYRIPKATKSQIADILDRCAKKKLTSAVALDELGDINARGTTIVSRDVTDKKESPPTSSATTNVTKNATENRINARVRDLEPFEQKLRATKIINYLDIGCGNGSITVGIGAHLNVAPENIFGADIPNWAGHNHSAESVPGFTFKAITRGDEVYSIQMEDKSCQLISMLMVLHHIADELLPLVFREISRILSPGGLVLIREHDSPNEMTDSLINIEHGLFEVAIENLTTGEDFGKSYYGKYRTKREWCGLFANFGFAHLGTTKHSGATRGYYSLFQHSGFIIPPIDSKGTPELVSMAQTIGASTNTIKSARNDADLKKLIIGGRRELVGFESQPVF